MAETNSGIKIFSGARVGDPSPPLEVISRYTTDIGTQSYLHKSTSTKEIMKSLATNNPK